MKKRRWYLLVGVCLVLLGFAGFQYFRKPDPTQLVTRGLEQLRNAQSYRFSVIQHQWVEGNDRLLTQIQGEKEGENTHITGNFLGSDIEMVHYKETLYSKDSFSKKWIKFAGTLSTQEVFLAELDPISSLQFKEIGEVMLTGQEKIDGKKVYVCNLKPSVQNQMMEEFWTDFEYTLYVRKSDQMLLKAVITAKSIAKAEPMSIILEFRDVGKKFLIEEPVTTTE